MRFIALLLISFGSLTAAAAPIEPAVPEKVRFNFGPAIRTLVDNPTRFAAVLPKRINAAKAGVWTTADGLATWEYAITVPDAINLGFYADDAFLPAGSTVTVTGENSEATYDSTRFARGTLITGTFSGDTLKVRVEIPAESAGSARFSIQRFHVGYRSLDGKGASHPLYRKLLQQHEAKKAAASGDSSDPKADSPVCDLNYRCKLDEKPEINELGQSTVAITFSGVGYCTGNLVADTSGSYTPYITTNAHCIDFGYAPNVYDPDNFLFIWEQETACGSALTTVDQTDPRSQTVGSVIRVMHEDGMLLEANFAPPIGTRPWWAGWDAQDTMNYTNPAPPPAGVSCDPSSPDYDPRRACVGIANTPLMGVHHGGGLTKQYFESGLRRSDTNFDTFRAFARRSEPGTFVDANGFERQFAEHDYWGVTIAPVTAVGRVTPGASGSALWLTNDKRIIGTLSTGGSQCATGDAASSGGYQRFAAVFKGPAGATADTAYKFWLDPANTGALVKDGSYNPARAGAASLTITPASSTATPNSSLRINYSTTKAGYCQISGTDMADRKVGYNGFITVNVGPAGTKTYTLSCVNDLQVPFTKSATVTVAEPTPAPVLTLNRSAGSITLGSPVTVTWSTTNATGCTASGDWAGTKATSGSEVITPATAGSKLYTLACTGPSGTDTESVSVTVNPASSSSGGSGSGGSSSGGSSGGGSFGFLSLLLLVPALRRRRV